MGAIIGWLFLLGSFIAFGVGIFNKNLQRNTRVLLGVIGGLGVIAAGAAVVALLSG